MSKIKALAGETAIYGMGSILPKILNFILVAPYLTRELTRGEYGIYSIIYAYIALIMAVVTLRLETSYFRFATLGGEKEKSFGTSVITIFLMSILFLLLVYFNAKGIAGTITDVRDAKYIRWFAFIIAFDAMVAIPFAKLRLENRAIKFALIKIINVIATIAIILFFLEFCRHFHANGSQNYWASLYEETRLLDYIFWANLVASAVVFILMIPEFFKFKLRFDLVLFKKMIRYSWPLILVGVAAAINQSFDRVFIAKLMPGTPEENEIAAGIYSGASKIAIIMSLFATAFNYAAEPFFYKNFKEKDAKVVYGKVALAFTVTACIVFLGITLYIDLVQYLIGKDFREGIYVVPVLLMAYLFLGLYYNFSIWYKLKDKTILGGVIALVGAFVTITFSTLLIGKIGMIGASWSILICFIVMCTLALWTGKKHYPIQYPLGKMAGYILLAIGLYALDFYIINPFAERLESPIIEFLVKTILFLSFLAFAYRQNKNILDT